jgi:hypothetical protein
VESHPRKEAGDLRGISAAPEPEAADRGGWTQLAGAGKYRFEGDVSARAGNQGIVTSTTNFDDGWVAQPFADYAGSPGTRPRSFCTSTSRSPT